MLNYIASFLSSFRNPFLTVVTLVIAPDHLDMAISCFLMWNNIGVHLRNRQSRKFYLFSHCVNSCLKIPFGYFTSLHI